MVALMIVNLIIVLSPLLCHWPADVPMEYRIIGKHEHYADKAMRQGMKEKGIAQNPCGRITVHLAGIGNTMFLLYPDAAGAINLVVDGSESPANILSADIAINQKARRKFISGIVQEEVEILQSPVIAVGKGIKQGWLFDGQRIIKAVK